MLARRFTMVCLIVTIFGMSLSILVSQTARSREIGAAVPCVFEGSWTCLPPRR